MQDEMTRQQKERSIWDRLSGSYDRNTLRAYRDAYDLSIQKTLALVQPDQQVLDIGCGTGILSLGIAPHVKRVMGVDISPQMVAVAQGKAAAQGVSNVDFKEMDGYTIPFASESFDHVLLFNILHVVKEPSRLLKEARRLLKPAGSLISATDCYAEPVPLGVGIKLTLQRLMKVFGMVAYLRYYHKQDLHHLLARNAFVIADTAVLHPAPVNYYIMAYKA
jgi:ubiquinone/menaquinone biosynthesis C-methylase UbiE